MAAGRLGCAVWLTAGNLKPRMNASNALLDERGNQALKREAAPDHNVKGTHIMATNIVPRDLLDLTDELQGQSAHMATCLGLVHEVLAFQQRDAVAVSRAVDRLYLLTESLEGMQKKFAALAKSADELRRLQAQAA